MAKKLYTHLGIKRTIRPHNGEHGELLSPLFDDIQDAAIMDRAALHRNVLFFGGAAAHSMLPQPAEYLDDYAPDTLERWGDRKYRQANGGQW